MAVDSYDPATGRPIFSDSGAPDIGVDPTAVGIYAADVGNRIIRADLAALNAYTFKRKGLRGYALDTGTEYTCDGSGWGPVSQRIGMKRGAGVVTISNSVYQDLSSGANWAESYRTGFATYANGIVVPVAGLYEVSYTITAAQSLFAAITVNKATGPVLSDFLASATGVLAQGVAVATASVKVPLLAGDTVRLWGIAASAGATWRTEPGLSSFQAQLV